MYKHYTLEDVNESMNNDGSDLERREGDDERSSHENEYYVVFEHSFSCGSQSPGSWIMKHMYDSRTGHNFAWRRAIKAAEQLEFVRPAAENYVILNCRYSKAEIRESRLRLGSRPIHLPRQAWRRYLKYPNPGESVQLHDKGGRWLVPLGRNESSWSNKVVRDEDPATAASRQNEWALHQHPKLHFRHIHLGRKHRTAHVKFVTQSEGVAMSYVGAEQSCDVCWLHHSFTAAPQDLQHHATI